MNDVLGAGHVYVRRQILKRLAEHSAGSVWGEIAQQVLNGSLTPAQVVTAEALREPVEDVLTRLKDRRDELGPEGFAAEAAEVRAVLQQMADQDRRERADTGAH